MPGIARADDDHQSQTTGVQEHEKDGDENENGDSHDDNALRLGAKLRPGQEVPPVVSDGQGRVSFEVDGATVSFRLHWEDFTTPAVAAHIHCAAVGATGPVGVTLFMGAMGTDNSIRGTFNAPDSGNACGWVTLSDVLGAVLSGNTYVNVHNPDIPLG